MAVEYFDRLSSEQRKALRAMLGGELGWKKTFPRLSKEQKLEVGRITFGCEVKNVRLTFERDVSSGYDIPVIIADVGEL